MGDEAGKRKRSRWDEDGPRIKPEPDPHPAPVAAAPVVVKLDPDIKKLRQEVNTEQPFKWGERVKKEPLPPGKHGPVSDKSEDSKEEVAPKLKANFGLTGALGKDENTGNLRNGVVLKFNEALDASVPDKKWRLYVFDGDNLKETLHIHRETSFLIGKDVRVADIIVDHHSISKQHALITFRNVEVAEAGFVDSGTLRVIKPYVMDLKSTNKTFLNRKKVQDSRYVELKAKDCLSFGSCPLDYVLLSEESAAT